MSFLSWKIAPSTAAPSYLILHSDHDGDLGKPWVVYRCHHDSDEQEELFRGEREAAAAFLCEHWDDQP
jgi:hypothetical protein